MKATVRNIKNKTIKAIIGLARKSGFPKNKEPGAKPSRFLIVSTTGIGDTLWGTPAIRAIKETYPDCSISVLTTSLGAELLKGNPWIDRVFVFKRGLRVFLLWKLLKKLMRERPDIAFIFHASDRIIWPLVFFTGTPQIMGIIGQNKGLDFILTKTIKQEAIHGAELRLRLVREAGVSFDNTLKPTLYLSEEERRQAFDLLKNITGFDRSTLIIGLHPGAQKPYKCWPAERFVETGKRLVKDTDCRIVVTGSKAERGLCEYIASRIDGAVSIAGKTSLRETAAIIERMSLFITNDTGPMHMAFALGIPTVALFCPTDPELCGPYNFKDAVIIKKPIICKPCTGKACLIPVCMEQITVEEVITATKRLIRDKGGEDQVG